MKREEAVTREMTRKLAEDKKMSKKEKDERYDGAEGLCIIISTKL